MTSCQTTSGVVQPEDSDLRTRSVPVVGMFSLTYPLMMKFRADDVQQM